MKNEYYKQVGAYYDDNCRNYESYYWQNPALQKIRQAFREEFKKIPFKTALEIGTGPGIDLKHFSTIFPDRQFFGIDVSDSMIAYAERKIVDHRLSNVNLEKASIEQITEVFPSQKYDVIYVFFGALNTTKDLKKAADQIYNQLNTGGHLVLTFVNKWYIADIFINLLTVKFKRAFERLGKVWYGYSQERQIESYCYSPKEVKRAFQERGTIKLRRGYSIVYPPWYRPKLYKIIGLRLNRILWDIDQRLLNRSFFWKYGEYTLFVFRSK